jgi:hypothetical protein
MPEACGPGATAGGGADGDRTHDLRLAKPALSHLSYGPVGPGAFLIATRAADCKVSGGPGKT